MIKRLKKTILQELIASFKKKLFFLNKYLLCAAKNVFSRRGMSSKLIFA